MKKYNISIIIISIFTQNIYLSVIRYVPTYVRMCVRPVAAHAGRVWGAALSGKFNKMIVTICYLSVIGLQNISKPQGKVSSV